MSPRPQGLDQGLTRDKPSVRGILLSEGCDPTREQVQTTLTGDGARPLTHFSGRGPAGEQKGLPSLQGEHAHTPVHALNKANGPRPAR